MASLSQSPSQSKAAPPAGAAYRTIWRWHFYAGLFVLPFILILSVTGSIYLFKPQIDAWEERPFRGLSLAGAVSPDRQVDAAMSVYAGSRFNFYRLPREPGDAALIQVFYPDGVKREVFVSPQGQVLGALDPDQRIAEVVKRFHGSLMLGTWGDYLVELAASWTIVMILTGLYLWWPRPFRLAGTLYPRLSLKGRALLKDWHRVTGFWIAGLVLVMLVSGLPWASAWGSAFKWARTEMGLISGPANWQIGPEDNHAATDHGAHDHSAHDHSAVMAAPPPVPLPSGPPLSAYVAKAQVERMAFPVLVLPPHVPQPHAPPTGDVWTVKSAAQNRTLNREVGYDPETGAEVSRSGFADRHVIDRVVNTGIAWHEGQLFGWANQLLGVLTALALMAVSVLGVWMWLKRRPQGRLGAPPPGDGASLRWAVAALVILAVLLPLFGASVLALAAIEAIARTVRRFSRA